MNTEENMIAIESHLEDFKQYLDVNSRCILSARFGDGKSYFISRFIKEYSEDYLFIPIYPVNYQVMDNKDIFELIKRDILIKLLSNEEINVNEVKLDTASLFYCFFINNFKDTFWDILGLLPDINVYGVDVNIGNVIKKIKKIEDKFKTYREQFPSTDKTSEQYISKFTSLKGSIYEFDTISQLICDIIREYKVRKPSKNVVLIIEDLDRIDPAHIFRILNVFSAHFDRYSPDMVEFDKTCGNNKFCLDKIVTVCDIDNIKNIYSHVYGENTDFNGYISKFSNSKAYRYSLKEGIKEYIVNKLFDEDLLKYTVICDILACNIISTIKDNETLENNLRIIKERVSRANGLIKPQSIALPRCFSNKYINPVSDFTKLLALLKTFDINFAVIHTNQTQKELKVILNKWAFLVLEFDNEIAFNVQNSRIDVSIIKREHNYTEWYDCDPFYNCFKGDELVYMNLARRDDREAVTSLIMKQINNIANRIMERIII